MKLRRSGRVKEPRRTKGRAREEPADRLDALREVSSRFFQHQTMITPDRYTVAQARHLDKYLVNKFYRAARLHNVEVSAREDLERFSDLLGK